MALDAAAIQPLLAATVAGDPVAPAVVAAAASPRNHQVPQIGGAIDTRMEASLVLQTPSRLVPRTRKR